MVTGAVAVPLCGIVIVLGKHVAYHKACGTFVTSHNIIKITPLLIIGQNGSFVHGNKKEKKNAVSPYYD